MLLTPKSKRDRDTINRKRKVITGVRWPADRYVYTFTAVFLLHFTEFCFQKRVITYILVKHLYTIMLLALFAEMKKKIPKFFLNSIVLKQNLGT